MIGIGIFQLRSKKPATFYTGEKGPKPEELSDMKAWNRKHGMMWIIYGIIILLGCVSFFFVSGTAWKLLGGLGVFLLPLPFMVWYHHSLMKKYIIK